MSFTRRFGITGVDVPLVGQGTWNMESDDRAAAVAALRRGFDLGLTHVDTAEMYGDGAVEEIVGEAMRGRRRDEIFLVSKVLPKNAAHDRVIRSCERSLQRLGTDHLDVYLLHWRSSTPLAETMRAFEQLVKAGKIRAWGVSNFDVDDMAEVLALAGAGRCACNQVLLHLEERYAAGKLREICARNNVALVAYSPLGSGSFPPSGKKKRALLEEIARAHHVTPASVALAFLARDAFVIPKASSLAHVEANAQAAALSLTEAEASSLAEAFPVEGTSLGMI